MGRGHCFPMKGRPANVTPPSTVQFFATPHGTIAFEIIEPAQPDAGARPLTLIHNFMSTGRAAWGALLPRLAHRRRVLLPDMPGHGQSIGYPAEFDHLAMAEDLAALMDHTGFADAGFLAGCSSGGMVAQLLVHHHLVEPAALALVSTTHSTDVQRTGTPMSLQPEQFRAGRNWLEATARLHDPYQGEGYFETTLLPSFRDLTPAATIDLDLADLTALTLPVCLIHGDQDGIFPVQIARNMAEAFQNAELHILAGQSHALIFRQPARVAAILDDFLTRQDLSR